MDFRDVIREELRQNPSGLTWAELKERLGLPFDRSCQTWVLRMEKEVGLSRARSSGLAYVWKVKPEKRVKWVDLKL